MNDIDITKMTKDFGPDAAIIISITLIVGIVRDAIPERFNRFLPLMPLIVSMIAAYAYSIDTDTINIIIKNGLKFWFGSVAAHRIYKVSVENK